VGGRLTAALNGALSVTEETETAISEKRAVFIVIDSLKNGFQKHRQERYQDAGGSVSSMVAKHRSVNGYLNGASNSSIVCIRHKSIIFCMF